MAEGIWGGLERATGTAAATGMQVMQIQNTREHQQALEADSKARLDIAKQAAFEQTKKAKMENEQMAKESRMVPIDEVLTRSGHGTPGELQYFKDKLGPYLERDNNTDYIRTKDFATNIIQLSKDPQANIEVADILDKHYSEKIGEIDTRLKTDPPKKAEEVAKLEQERTALVSKKTDTFNKKLAEQRKMVAANKDKSINVQLPDGTWASVDPVTGLKTPLPGTPESAVKTQNTADTAAGLEAGRNRRADDANASRERAADMRGGNTGRPQQSQFIDTNTGLPMIYDPRTQSYRPAQVEGGGGVEPRPVNPSAGEREKTAAFSVLKDQLARIKDTYKSKYVGLVSGQAGRVTQLIDKDEAAFRQVILDVKDSLLRARSGAQINEQEYKRLAKLVPDFADSEPQFAGKMKSFESTINTILAERTKAQKQGGVKLRSGGVSLPDDLKAGW